MNRELLMLVDRLETALNVWLRAECSRVSRPSRNGELALTASSSGRATFCSAVKTGMRLYNWKMKPTFAARQSASSASESRVMSSPPTSSSREPA